MLTDYAILSMDSSPIVSCLVGWATWRRLQIRHHVRNERKSRRDEVTTYEPPFRLVIRQTGGRLPEKAYVEEIYELSQENGRTLLRQRIIVHHSGINIVFRVLIFFITRFGRPVGKTYLATLNELVEKASVSQVH